MKSIKNFKSNINTQEAANIKGGTNFCEWYINQRTSRGEKVVNGHLNQAMYYDSIAQTEGEEAAMDAGGSFFMTLHSY